MFEQRRLSPDCTFLITYAIRTNLDCLFLGSSRDSVSYPLVATLNAQISLVGVRTVQLNSSLLTHNPKQVLMQIKFQLSRGAKGFNFCVRFHQLLYFFCASSEGTDHTAPSHLLPYFVCKQ